MPHFSFYHYCLRFSALKNVAQTHYLGDGYRWSYGTSGRYGMMAKAAEGATVLLR